MAHQWFVVRNGKEQGPITAQALRELASTGQLKSDDLVRREDLKAPRPASSIQGLFPPIASLPPVPPPAVPSPMPPPVTPPPAQIAAKPNEPAARLIGAWQKLTTPAKVAIAAVGTVFLFPCMCCSGLFMMAAVNESGNGQGGVSSFQGEAIQVSAFELFRDYEANEIAADEKYKGKVLEISGSVDSIGKDILDSIYVTLRAGGEYNILSVQCYFDDQYTSEAAQLRSGQFIKVRGRCDGKFGNVMIKDCQFVQ